MYKNIEEKFGRLDGLVNNAVYDNIFSIEDLTPEEFRKELDVNYCTSEAATVMLTKCCALELTSKYNIKVNTVSPSMTLTPLAKKSYTEE